MKLLKLSRAFIKIFFFLLYLNCFECNLNNFLFKIIPASVKCINLVEENNKERIEINGKYLDGISVYRKSYKNIIETNISSYKEVNCDFFILVSDDNILINNIFKPNKRIFYPFTKFLIIYFGDKEFHFEENSLNLINLNAFDVMWTKLNKTLNVISKELFHTIENKTFFWKNYSHGFFSENNLLKAHFISRRTVRVSLFNCSPFVLTENNEFDGVEYRCLKEITKNWKIEFNLNNNLLDSWQKTISDTINNISDISMCSVWQNIDNFNFMDLSLYIDHQCITFVVPKPLPIPQATFIYLSFNSTVWIVFIFTLITTTMLLNVLTLIRNKLKIENIKSSKFVRLSTSLTEIVNSATSHEISNIPKNVPIRILLISWILTCLCLGTSYSTGYTSLLMSPPYTKRIDDVHEFLEQGLYWLGSYSDSFLKSLGTNGNKDYQELSKRFAFEETDDDRYEKLSTGKYAKMVKRLSYNFVTDTESFGNLSTRLKLMKQCLREYYTVFAFQKNSVLTKLFDLKISQ